jgi:hypothetical protein
MDDTDIPNTSNVIRLKIPGVRREGPSVTAKADVAEDARRSTLAETLRNNLESKKAMAPEDAFVLQRNLRNLIYGLRDEGRLDPKDVAREARGPNTPRLVQAIEEYVLPQGIETQADLDARHPTRTAAKKPSGYMKLALAAARLAEMDPREALMRLADGSSFWPGANLSSDADRQVAHELTGVLDHLPGFLERIFPLRRYFDLVERHEILPDHVDGRVHFTDQFDYQFWDFTAIPAVLIGRRYSDSRSVVLAVSSEAATDRSTRCDFDSLVANGRAIPTTVYRQQTFSLGVGRIGGTPRPVGILGHEIVLGHMDGIEVVENVGIDRYEPGWHRLRLRVSAEEEPVWAAWRLTDLPDYVPEVDEETGEEYPDHEPPPDVVVAPITTEWLLSRTEPGWRPSRRTGRAKFSWRWSIESMRGRLEPTDGLPALIERFLLADQEHTGFTAELAEEYKALSVAVREWVALADAENSNQLTALRDRLRDAVD